MLHIARITIYSAALAALIQLAACSSTGRPTQGDVVLNSDHVQVYSLPPLEGAQAVNVLPLLHVACTPDDRFLTLRVVIFDDIDGNGRMTPSEPSETWAMLSDGMRAGSMEWRGMQLPPGDDLRAELDATLERHGRFQGTWRVSPVAQ